MEKLSFSDEDINTLIAMWNRGESGSTIAKALGRTRGSIMGKLHRMQNAGAVYNRQPKTSQPRKKASPRPKKPRPARYSKTRYTAPAPVSEPLHTALEDLTAKQCHYPFGEGPYSFCGHEVQPGTPYCPHHKKITTSTFWD